MKTSICIKTQNFFRQLAAICCAGSLCASALAADIQKADTADALNVGTSWTLGSAPGGGDNALWDNSVSVNTTSSLGDHLAWNGILMGYAVAGAENQPAAGIVLNGDGVNTLTLKTNGINLRGATSQSGTRPNLTINADVILGNPQTWTVYGFTRVLTVDGAVTGAFDLTKASGGQLTFLRENSFANLNISGGTVNIGNGGTAGSLGLGAVNIGNGTALVFNRSDDIAITNNFTGGNSGLLGGRFDKKGAGSMTLAPTNPNYYGRCVLVAGTLVLTNEVQLGNNPGGASATANALEFNGGTLRAAESFTIDDSKRGIQIDASTTGSLNVDTSKTLTVSNAITGVGSLRKQGNGTLALAAANTFAGSLTIVGGVARFDHSSGQPGGLGVSGGTSQLRFNGGVAGLASGDCLRNIGATAADVEFVSSGGFAAYAANRTVNLGGAAATAVWGGPQFFPGAGSLIFGFGDATHTVNWLNPIDLGGGDRTISVNNGAADVDAVLHGDLSNGSVTKVGAGTLALAATNTYTGPTTVTAGTLLVNGVLSSASVSVANATLGGTGLVLGAVNCAGTLAPGASIGTLTVSNNVTLTGRLLFEISRSGATLTNDLLRGVATLDVTGATLTVTNVGPDEPVAGNTFVLFAAQSVAGTFAATNLPVLTDPNLSWNTAQLGSGILSVTAGVTPPSATNLVATVSGGSLNLSWPANAGWRLEAQTNTLAEGLLANWVNVPVLTNSLSVPMNPANPAVFFRLAYP